MKHIINHIAFVIDESGSMGQFSKNVVSVFDDQIKFLSEKSQELDQETRVSVYLFGGTEVKCIIYDRDVMRLPSLKNLYKPAGGTPLFDALDIAAQDLFMIPEIHADHAFLVYVVTDGGENASSRLDSLLFKDLVNKINNKENYTLAVFVPSKIEFEINKQLGFLEENICIWDTSNHKSFNDVGTTIRTSTTQFFKNRSTGIRKSTNLFKVDVNFTKTELKENLTELSKSSYKLFNISREATIKPFVEKETQKPYVKGNSFYQLVKPEVIQNYKDIIILDKNSGRVYGGLDARNLLGLPNFDIKVSPGDFDKYDIFVQSTSVNRKLLAGTKLVVL